MEAHGDVRVGFCFLVVYRAQLSIAIFDAKDPLGILQSVTQRAVGAWPWVRECTAAHFYGEHTN